MSGRRCLAVLAGLVLLAGCERPPRDGYSRKLAKADCPVLFAGHDGKPLDLRQPHDPVADARRAIAANERALIMTYSDYPGLTILSNEKFDDLKDRVTHHSEAFRGLGISWEGRASLEAANLDMAKVDLSACHDQDAAMDVYARAYNDTLLEDIAKRQLR